MSFPLQPKVGFSYPVELVVDFRDSPVTQVIKDVGSAAMVASFVAGIRSQWEKSKKGRKVTEEVPGMEYVARFSDGKQPGRIYVNPLPPVASGGGAQWDKRQRKPRGPETGRAPA